MSATILHGDCVAMMRELPEASIDAIVTDPPYGLEFMGKEWDKLDGGLPQESVWKGRRGQGGSSIGTDDTRPGSRHRVAYGAKKSAFRRCAICGRRQFSGTPCQCEAPDWVIEYPDGAPSSAIRMQRWHEAWAREAFRVLKPGGHLLAFGGTRTYHRMACAIEDAGFEIRDCLQWLYGSGFPKSHDVSKAIDKAAGAEREYVPAITAPATPEAEHWQGWGTALKPANEPIVLARKPLSEPTVAANVLRWGTGALAIDACRITTMETLQGSTVRNDIRGGQFANGHRPNPGDIPAYQQHVSGRWPANVILSHSLFCTDDACDPSCAVALLDGQSGERKSGARNGVKRPHNDFGAFQYREHDTGKQYDASSGGASRYYKVCNWDARERSSTVQYVEETEAQPCGDESTGAGNTSAGKRTASSGGNSPTDGSGSKPTDVSLTDTKSTTSTTTRSTMTYRTSSSSPLDGTTTTTNDSARTTEPLRASSNDAASDAASTSRSQDSSGVQREPIKGTATSANGNTSKSGESATENATTPTCASTASAPSNSRFYYVAKASRKERRGSKHPTVKPVALMRYLIRLIAPPGGVVLDPFAGSGTTGEAALLEGVDCVLIEREAEYIADIRARLESVAPIETAAD